MSREDTVRLIIREKLTVFLRDLASAYERARCADTGLLVPEVLYQEMYYIAREREISRGSHLHEKYNFALHEQKD